LLLLDPKPGRDSRVETRHLVMPEHVNPNGTLFGGMMVSWIDVIAAMSAMRHAKCAVVTASIDTIVFEAPVLLGDQVILMASVNYVGRTSMEVGVKALVEDLATGKQSPATHAYLTFVALDGNRRPTPIPRVIPNSSNEVRRYRNAELRMQARKALRNLLH
jgi:acyl-CoA hydrolase